MQNKYEVLKKKEATKLKSFISVKGNLKLAERKTDLNVNTIKRAAEGLRVTIFSIQTLRDFLTSN